MDMKTPGSDEMKKNLEENIALLSGKDQVKFVICDRNDYEWSKQKVQEFDLLGKVADDLFSPSKTQLEARDLAEWILQDNLKVRFQLQLHKYIWGDDPGH